MTPCRVPAQKLLLLDTTVTGEGPRENGGGQRTNIGGGFGHAYRHLSASVDPRTIDTTPARRYSRLRGAALLDRRMQYYGCQLRRQGSTTTRHAPAGGASTPPRRHYRLAPRPLGSLHARSRDHVTRIAGPRGGIYLALRSARPDDAHRARHGRIAGHLCRVRTGSDWRTGEGGHCPRS